MRLRTEEVSQRHFGSIFIALKLRENPFRENPFHENLLLLSSSPIICRWAFGQAAFTIHRSTIKTLDGEHVPSSRAREPFHP